MDIELDLLEGGSGIGKGVRGGLLGTTVSNEEPSCGSGERESGRRPIGLDEEKEG